MLVTPGSERVNSSRDRIRLLNLKVTSVSIVLNSKQ